MPKCKYCGCIFKPKYKSTEKYCQATDCRTSYAIETIKKQKDLNLKAEKKSLKDNTTNWKNELQKEINKIVRIIDKDLLCLARNKGGQIHAGHIYSRGSSPTIRYNLHNIHRQNAQSNHFQNDDGLLREGLVNEYGQLYMDFISNLRQTTELKYKPNDYKEFTLKARKIVLRLKKLDLKYSLDNRIILRNKINIELGIYPNIFCIFNE